MTVAEIEDRELVDAALDGDESACEELVVRLTPIIQQRVGRVLAASRWMRASWSSQREDLLELMQQMLLLLFERSGKVLASWKPERGLSLNNFVGLVVERESHALLRSGRRSAWAETPTADDILEAYCGESRADDAVSVRDDFTEIWRRLEGQLSPRGMALFRALLVDELPVDEVCERFQMSATAVYNFRSRVRKRVRKIRASLTEAERVDIRHLQRVESQSARPSAKERE